jgi:hypothetical protein
VVPATLTLRRSAYKCWPIIGASSEVWCNALLIRAWAVKYVRPGNIMVRPTVDAVGASFPFPSPSSREEQIDSWRLQFSPPSCVRPPLILDACHDHLAFERTDDVCEPPCHEPHTSRHPMSGQTNQSFTNKQGSRLATSPSFLYHTSANYKMR